VLCLNLLDNSNIPAGASLDRRPDVGLFPPSGTHQYEFSLYALGHVSSILPRKITFEVVTKVVKGDLLATATLVGTFTKIRK
jgi:phosphatidylethanolamine-binding protein (PEBP) family uncharacterized protein